MDFSHYVWVEIKKKCPPYKSFDERNQGLNWKCWCGIWRLDVNLIEGYSQMWTRLAERWPGTSTADIDSVSGQTYCIQGSRPRLRWKCKYLGLFIYTSILRSFCINNLELYAYLTLLKYNLNIEYQICKSNNRALKVFSLTW